MSIHKTQNKRSFRKNSTKVCDGVIDSIEIYKSTLISSIKNASCLKMTHLGTLFNLALGNFLY